MSAEERCRTLRAVRPRTSRESVSVLVYTTYSTEAYCDHASTIKRRSPLSATAIQASSDAARVLRHSYHARGRRLVVVLRMRRRERVWALRIKWP